MYLRSKLYNLDSHTCIYVSIKQAKTEKNFTQCQKIEVKGNTTSPKNLHIYYVLMETTCTVFNFIMKIISEVKNEESYNRQLVYNKDLQFYTIRCCNKC